MTTPTPAARRATDPTPYTAAFFDAQQDISRRSAERIVPHVLSLFRIGSVVDVGCGVGTWLSVFREQGIEDILGLDGPYVARERLLIPGEHFIATDLEQAWGVNRRFDLAVSLEVAEHLPAASAPLFVEQLCRLADLVLFSAAIPHQGGTHHVNEQWPSYWIALFQRHGMHPVDVLRRQFWTDAAIDLCYRNNCLLFANEAAFAAHPTLRALAEQSIAAIPDVVHPERYAMLIRSAALDRLSLTMLLRLLPSAFLRALRRRLKVARPA